MRTCRVRVRGSSGLVTSHTASMLFVWCIWPQGQCLHNQRAQSAASGRALHSCQASLSYRHTQGQVLHLLWH